MPDKDKKQPETKDKDDELYAAPLEVKPEEIGPEALDEVEGGSGRIGIHGPRRISGVNNDTLFAGDPGLLDSPLKSKK